MAGSRMSSVFLLHIGRSPYEASPKEDAKVGNRCWLQALRWAIYMPKGMRRKGTPVSAATRWASRSFIQPDRVDCRLAAMVGYFVSEASIRGELRARTFFRLDQTMFKMSPVRKTRVWPALQRSHRG